MGDKERSVRGMEERSVGSYRMCVSANDLSCGRSVDSDIVRGSCMYMSINVCRGSLLSCHNATL